MRRLAYVTTILLALFSIGVARADDCTGTPAAAIMKLPPPLDKWGQIVCTPYGHIITARQGWLWNRPGAYSPVWVPAQMVKQDPAPLGNQSYFTKIDFTKVSGDELQIPYQAFSQFRSEGPPPPVYRLDVTSISGSSLRLYFLDYPSSPWGVWCSDGKCDSSQIFMILDMSKAPKDSQKSKASQP